MRHSVKVGDIRCLCKNDGGYLVLSVDESQGIVSVFSFSSTVYERTIWPLSMCELDELLVAGGGEHGGVL